ncbi:hypothetical protein LCGC14_2114570 [marine sediment metagenome]|uniref:Uncharacterized protein n=1 Tax=marine sediment metagenome TaxID=412755 RepID=A0A0F9GJ54_9ZZZZ
MPTKDSRVIGVRIKESLIEQIKRRANRKGWTVNRWMNWAIQEGLRSHKKGVNNV